MSYIRITAGKFRLEDDNGNPAARGKVYTYTAGTSTAATSYSDRGLTVANTNPIILDERGECELYTGVALKLIATDSNDVVIWTEDYQGEQQEQYIISGPATGDVDNNYVMDVTPPFTSIPDDMTIVMDPDRTNADTFTSESTVGVTGVNDLTWVGPYSGTTSGSTFSVQIDGVRFQGTGLSDIIWTGDAPNHVHTVRISTAAAPNDKFQWRKDGGAWSTEANIVAGAIALDADVSITFGAITGHVAGDLWNNKDTFQWRKDGGAWTTGVAIYPRIGVGQDLLEGISVIFATETGHTLNDIWTLTVKTPPRLNFCSLGSKIIYKNVDGSLKALDGGDIVVNMPAMLIYSDNTNSFILTNPSLPVLSTLPRTVYRRELVSSASMAQSDAGNEIAYIGVAAGTLTLLGCAVTAGKIFDLVNASNYLWTIQVDTVAHPTDRIMTPEAPAGVTSFVLGASTRMSCRIESNGVNWHIPFDANFIHGHQLFTTTGNFVCPDGVYTIYVTGCAAGGGGAGAATGAGGGGGAGTDTRKQALTTVPGTTYVVTIAAAGTGGVGDNHGIQGGNLTLGALLTLTGGASGIKQTGAYAVTASAPPVQNLAVAMALPGVGGQFGSGGAGGMSASVDGVVNAMNGLTGSGYGAGGGGGAAAAGTANGGAGAPGFLLIEW